MSAGQDGYIRWPLASDIDLFLSLGEIDGSPLTGSAPLVSIRRYSNISGNLDNYYWDGSSSFTATPTFLSMSEVDATNSPGLYTYKFEQSSIQQEIHYNVYYKNDNPVGFSVENHIVTNSVTDVSDLRVYESEPDPRI